MQLSYEQVFGMNGYGRQYTEQVLAERGLREPNRRWASLSLLTFTNGKSVYCVTHYIRYGNWSFPRWFTAVDEARQRFDELCKSKRLRTVFIEEGDSQIPAELVCVF